MQIIFSNLLRVVLLPLLAISVAASCSLIARAQDELLTQAPAEYRIYGSVGDPSGAPIPEATVSLITMPSLFDRIEFFHPRPAISSAQCETDGNFDIRILGTDPRWLKLNPWTELLLVVQSPGHATLVSNISKDRLLVDYPISASLEKLAGWSLKVLDQNGTPVDDVRLEPALIAGTRLPYNTDLFTPAKSTGEGNYWIENVKSNSLAEVFITSETLGNHRVTVEQINGEYVAALPSRGTIKGKFILPNDVDPSELAGEQIFVGTAQPNGTAARSQPFSWTLVSLDEQASFTANELGFGQVVFDFTERESIKYCGSMSDFQTATLSAENTPLEISRKLFKSRTIKLRFVDSACNPIPNLAAGHAGIRAIRDSAGNLTIRLPIDEKPANQLFVYDATDQFLVTSNAGVLLDRIELDGDVAKPIELARARSVRGRVIDQQGNVIAGAKIEYSVNSGRFNMTKSVLSSQSGTFEIRGVAPDANVTLKASKNDLSTAADANISVIAGQSNEVTVLVAPQPRASIVGQINDANGSPIAGANVKLFKAAAYEAEGFGNESLAAVDLIANFEGVVSDEYGIFRYPKTTLFNERILVVVSAPGYRDLSFPFIDGSKREAINETLDIGKFQLFKLPTPQATVIKIVDRVSKTPIQNASLVFFGFDSGRQTGKTDSSGNARIDLVDTRQLVAVKAEGYQLKLKCLETIPDTIQISLDTADDEAKTLPWLSKPWSLYHDPAQKLIRELPLPVPGESSFYRQSMFFSAQINADFEAFEKIISQPKKFEYQDYFLTLNATKAFLQDAGKAIEMLGKIEFPPEQKAPTFAHFALLSLDTDAKDELYGEAIVLSSECSGTKQQIAVGRIISYLVIDGKIDVAKELAADAWSNATELQNQLSAKETKSRVAESRIFVPQIGLIDIDAAIELTRLTAREVEVPRLINECLAFASIGGDQDLPAACKKHGVTFDASGMSPLIEGLDLARGKYQHISKWVQQHLQVMPDSNSKIAAIMFAARHMPQGAQRMAMIKMAADARASCDASYHWNDPAKEILEELPKFDSLTTQEFDELLFATLKHAPARTETFQSNGVYANVIRMIAVRDPEVARNLLDDAFENGAWLYGDPTWSAFKDSLLLKAYAWIDPQLACDKARNLAEEFSVDGSVRSIELLSSVVLELNDIAIRKGAPRDN